MIVWITFAVALLISWISIPIIRKYSFRYKWVAMPRSDRWHHHPTPTLGGIGMFVACGTGLFAALFFTIWRPGGLMAGGGPALPAWTLLIRSWGFLAGVVFIFGLGLVDDLKRISPPAKLIGQIIAATIVVSTGTVTNFFTPRLADPWIAQAFNILLSIIWLVGITNAINLLDNMDGLAGGIALITASLLGFLFWQIGNWGLVILSAALVGSILGFLIYNFPPAKIFMGDSGSMFLGFMLACLAIARQPQASNVIAVLGVPTLLFLLPILDTTLVTVTRLLRGESPTRGGRDHTSHRLIAFGLNEKQVLWILYGVALLSGILAVGVESIGYWLSLVLAPVVIIGLALVAAYLGGMKIQDTAGLRQASSGEGPAENRINPLAQIILDLTFKRRLFEILLDFVIILLAFYLAFISRYGANLNDLRLAYFTRALPVVLGMTFLSFFFSGVYRGVWRYVGIDDFVRMLVAALSSLFFTAALTYLLFALRSDRSLAGAFSAYPPVIFILYGLYLFLGLAISRSSFRVLDRFASQQNQTDGKRILIYGAGDAGEMAVRWILMNPQLNYQPVGFIDRNPFMSGRWIHGIRVLGDLEELDRIFLYQHIDGIILTEVEDTHRVLAIARRCHCWVQKFQIEFEKME